MSQESTPPPSPPLLRRSPTMQEQLEEKRQELGFRPPKIYEGERKISQKRSAVEMLEKSRRLSGLHGGKRRTRRVPKRRVKRTRKTRKV